MIRFLMVLALATMVPVTPAASQEMQPRFVKLFSSFQVAKDKRCPHVLYEYGMGDMVPAIALRKDKDSNTEFIRVRYYPMYGLVTYSVKTAGKRFENKCREAAVSVLAKSGAIDGATFVGCPGKESDDFVEPYGFGKDGKPTGDRFKFVWQKRADDFLSEAESTAALCK